LTEKVFIMKGYLAINIPLLRSYTGISQEQLANRLGVRVTAIENIETGYTTSPPEKILQKLSEVFGTTIAGLLGLEPLVVGERVRVVHVVESVDADMSFVDAEKIVGAVYFDVKEIGGYNCFGIKVSDNSMLGDRIGKGDIAVIKQNAPIKNGNTVLCVVDGQEAVVRYYYKMNGTVVLKPADSSGTYPEIRKDENDPGLKIIGKVIKIIQNRD